MPKVSWAPQSEVPRVYGRDNAKCRMLPASAGIPARADTESFAIRAGLSPFCLRSRGGEPGDRTLPDRKDHYASSPHLTRRIRRSARPVVARAPSTDARRSGHSVRQCRPDLAPLCVKRGRSRPGKCAPVLAVVEQTALDDVCGPAPAESARRGQENGLAFLA